MGREWKVGDRVVPTHEAWAFLREEARRRLPSAPLPGRVDHLTGFVWVLHDDGNLRAWHRHELGPESAEPVPTPDEDTTALRAKVARLTRELDEAQRSLAQAVETRNPGMMVEDAREPGDGDRPQGAGRMAL